MQIPIEELVDVQDLDGLLANHHIVITGTTGSGKTKLQRRMAERSSRHVVFINSGGEPLRGFRTARTPRDVKRLIGLGVRKIQWRPPRMSKGENELRVLQEALGIIVNDLLGIGEKLRGGRDKADHWCSLFIDEAQRFAPKSRGGPVDTVFNEGRKYGVRCVLGTLRPAKVSHTALDLADLHIIFETNPNFTGKYWESCGVPFKEIQGELGGYRFVLVRNGRWAPFGKLKRV